MGKAIDIPAGNTTIQVLIHDNNAGALILVKIFLSQFTSQSKHYHTKTIWVQKEIVKHWIKLLKISTPEQLGVLSTKGLPKPGFEHLRKKLMGW